MTVEHPAFPKKSSFPFQRLKSISEVFLSPASNLEAVSVFLIVLLASSLGILLTLQGWRSRVPAHDLVPHIYNVLNLVKRGWIPIHGDTGSYGSYKPPGTAWLMLPSTLMFSDLRLVEYFGSALLHLATITGIFLLARRYFGFTCACLAVLIYGLSDVGINLAGSLWPNGRPDFFIWIIYFASQWVNRRNAKYLAAALGIWGIGMNVDMAILPAIIMLGGLWIYFHPPIWHKLLFATAALVSIVWFPYLRFETGRGFADMRSQVFFQNIFPANFRQTWCVPSLQLRQWGETSNLTSLNFDQPSALEPGLMHSGFTFIDELRGKLTDNFQDIAPVPGASLALIFMTLISLILFAITGASVKTPEGVQKKPALKDRITGIALGMILVGLLANEFVIARILGINGSLGLPVIRNLRTIEKLLIFGGVCILGGRWLAVVINALFSRAGIALQSKEHRDQVRVLILGLAIPWFILLMVAEPGKPERFWWIMPLQSIFLAAFITWILPRFRVPWPIIGFVAILTLSAILWNPTLLARVNAWRQTGWSGTDAPEIQVVNLVSKAIRAEGKNQAAIGYRLIIYEFMASYNITNPEYKVGNLFDLLFQYPNAVVNTDRCAEGFSPQDEYRIVQTKRLNDTWAPSQYFAVPMDSGYKLIGQFGPYQVYKRN